MWYFYWLLLFVFCHICILPSEGQAKLSQCPNFASLYFWFSSHPPTSDNLSTRKSISEALNGLYLQCWQYCSIAGATTELQGVLQPCKRYCSLASRWCCSAAGRRYCSVAIINRIKFFEFNLISVLNECAAGRLYSSVACRLYCSAAGRRYCSAAIRN